MRARACAIAVAFILAALSPSGAQSPQPSPSPQPPVFRSTVQLVEIDVSVTDRTGEFVHGLTKNDFQILEDGVPQTVSSFLVVDLPLDPPPAANAAIDTVEPDVTTNTNEGRLYVMLLDCCSPIAGNADQASQIAPSWASTFVDRALRPNDIMGVVHVRGNISDGQPFTSNKTLLRASINRYVNASSLDAGGDSTDACQIAQEKLLKLRATYDAIRDVSDRLGGVAGRRKAILWVNANIPFDPVAEFGGDSTSSACAGGAAMASSAAFMHRDAIRAATRNNVAIYPIDPSGLTTGLGELSRSAALRAVAEDTGGDAVVGINNYEPLYERIVRQNSTYYLIGYYPAVEHRDGRFHNVTVRVRRPNLSVRARKGYFAPVPTAVAPAPAAPVSILEGLSPSGRGALRSPAPVRGLGIDLFAAPFKGTGASASVVIGAQLRGSDLRLGAGERVEISYLPIDKQGKIGRGSRKVFTLNFKQETRTQVEQSGLRFVDRIPLTPGRHELRFVVHQPGGATGSVVAQVDVPDFSRERFIVSGLVVASANAAPYTVLSDAAVKAALSADPTSIRRFTLDDELTAYAEVYANGARAPTDIDMTYSIETESGDVVRTKAGVLEQKAPRATPGRFAYVARMSLLELRAGKYILTARAESADGTLAAARQIPFTIAR